MDELTAFWREQLRSRRLYNEARQDTEDQIIRLAAAQAHRGLASIRPALPAVPPACRPAVLVDMLGLKLTESRRVSFPRFGEYDSQTRQIILYPETIGRYQQDFLEAHASLRDACVAHELFHALEAERLGSTDRVIRRTLGLRTVWSSRALSFSSEIGAHTFAQGLLDLSRPPLAFWPARSSAEKAE